MSGQDSLIPRLQISQFYIPPGFIDLGIGDPQFELLPMDLIHQAANEQFSHDNPEFLQYGSKQGDGTFRQSLAKFLSAGYGFPTRPDELFITSGASMGLHLICSLFTRPGDAIFVEEPTYFFALRIFADHGLRLVPILTDENGLVVESLEEQLKIIRPKFLYIIPTYQNPTGRTLSSVRRELLAQLSREYGFILVADEVYHFLTYSGLPPKPFAAQVHEGNIISLGSFSKILAPGLRLGWLQADAEIIQHFITSGLLESGGGMNPFTSAIVNHVLVNGGLEKNISKLIETYRHRMQVMDRALSKYLPGVVFAIPQGGFYFWIQLPGKLNAFNLLRHAEVHKVGFRHGTLFSSQNGFQDFLRLSYVFYGPDELEQGVQRIGLSLEHS